MKDFVLVVHSRKFVLKFRKGTRMFHLLLWVSQQARESMSKNLSRSAKVFGPSVVEYAHAVSGALTDSIAFRYSFVETDELMAEYINAQVSVAELNQVTIAEVFDVAHMAAVTSIFRASRWMETAWDSFETRNAYGLANAFRGLLEAVGDAAMSLGGIALTFAENRGAFANALAGREASAVHTFFEIEDALIHYGHGRRLNRQERATAPSQHAARTSTDYIDYFAAASMPRARELYRRLCELGHPSRSSIDFLYVNDGSQGFRIDPSRERAVLDELLGHREIWEAIPSMAFNPGLLILRVLEVYGRHPTVAALRGFQFQSAPIWRRIEPLL